MAGKRRDDVREEDVTGLKPEFRLRKSCNVLSSKVFVNHGILVFAILFLHVAEIAKNEGSHFHYTARSAGLWVRK